MTRTITLTLDNDNAATLQMALGEYGIHVEDIIDAGGLSDASREFCLEEIARAKALWRLIQLKQKMQDKAVSGRNRKVQPPKGSNHE